MSHTIPLSTLGVCSEAPGRGGLMVLVLVDPPTWAMSPAAQNAEPPEPSLSLRATLTSSEASNVPLSCSPQCADT